mmetsp:Transcript_25909/g.64735  ORF Transcript_25909/g.64735 Transcript_25909/m.64735 type:complete len:83 (-) Transcript_25909:210-458(-)
MNHTVFSRFIAPRALSFTSSVFAVAVKAKIMSIEANVFSRVQRFYSAGQRARRRSLMFAEEEARMSMKAVALSRVERHYPAG